MNTNTTRRPAAPQSPVSAALRAVTVVGVAALLALAWTGAEQASHQAVRTASEAFSRGATHVTLPAVKIIARRDTAAASRI